MNETPRHLLVLSLVYVVLVGSAPGLGAEDTVRQPDRQTSNSSATSSTDAREKNASYKDGAKDLAPLGLLPMEQHGDILRYILFRPQGRGSEYKEIWSIVQFALSEDGSRAQLSYIKAEAVPQSDPVMIRRETGWISGASYSDLEAEIVRLGSSYSVDTAKPRNVVLICTHSPRAQLDVRVTGETRLDLTRRGGCRRPAPTYQAGELMVGAAERALGHEIKDAHIILRP